MLQNLPPELITAIFEDLPQSDVASSATVSRVVCYVAERTLYSNVVVDHQTVEALAESFRTSRPERAAFVTCLQVTDKSKGLDIGDTTVGVRPKPSKIGSQNPEGLWKGDGLQVMFPRIYLYRAIIGDFVIQLIHQLLH
ncbi:hypothetical protein B0H14DRAFT_2599867 [Mycena olivaceomarginata]|nr:hypothetical protein B0H14DRAFT_2599867 [Mycena olivaceomarginata]